MQQLQRNLFIKHQKLILKRNSYRVSNGESVGRNWCNSRVNLYEVTYVTEKRPEEHVIELDDSSVRVLSETEWTRVIERGLRACGYIDRQNVRTVKPGIA